MHTRVVLYIFIIQLKIQYQRVSQSITEESLIVFTRLSKISL